MPADSYYAARRARSAGWRSLLRALVSIWRARSRVRPMAAPTSSSVDGRAAAEPEAAHQDLALALGQRLGDDLRHLVAQQVHAGLAVDRLVLLVDQQVAQVALLGLADRRLQRDHRAGRAQHAVDLVAVQAQRARPARPRSARGPARLPNCWPVRASAFMVCCRCAGSRTMRPLSSRARVMAWRIHHTA